MYLIFCTEIIINSDTLYFYVLQFLIDAFIFLNRNTKNVKVQINLIF